MSGSGVGSNVFLWGGQNGNPIAVSEGFSMFVQQGMDKVKNIGRLILRTAAATRLPDAPAAWVMIFNKEGNGTVWIAGFATDTPASGVGIPLIEGHPITLPCTNLNQWTLIPEVDGDEVYVIFGLAGPDVDITPGNPSPLDRIAPTITSSVPAGGATNISQSVTIIITASEALDPTTIDSTTVTLKLTNSPFTTISATTSLDSADPTKITIKPDVNLSGSTSYTVVVTTSVKDVVGNALAAPFTFAFTTIATPPPPDTTPPTVVSHTPALNATSVSISVIPSITFSEPMLSSTINANTIKIVIASNNQLVPSTAYSLSTDLKTVTVSGQALANSTAYRLDVIGGASGVKDVAGNALAVTYSIPFSTIAPSLETVYSVGGNTYDDLYSGNYTETSIKVATSTSKLKGRIPKKYKPILKKVGSPSGNVDIIWQRQSGSSWTTFRTLKTVAASSIGTADTIVDIDDSVNTSAIATGDRITVKYASGSSSSKIQVKKADTNVYDGNNTINTKVLLGFTFDYTDSDLAMTIECQ